MENFKQSLVLLLMLRFDGEQSFVQKIINLSVMWQDLIIFFVLFHIFITCQTKIVMTQV